MERRHKSIQNVDKVLTVICQLSIHRNDRWWCWFPNLFREKNLSPGWGHLLYLELIAIFLLRIGIDDEAFSFKSVFIVYRNCVVWPGNNDPWEGADNICAMMACFTNHRSENTRLDFALGFSMRMAIRPKRNGRGNGTLRKFIIHVASSSFGIIRVCRIWT